MKSEIDYTKLKKIGTYRNEGRNEYKRQLIHNDWSTFH